jgi:hypothetical protein
LTANRYQASDDNVNGREQCNSTKKLFGEEDEVVHDNDDDEEENESKYKHEGRLKAEDDDLEKKIHKKVCFRNSFSFCRCHSLLQRAKHVVDAMDTHADGDEGVPAPMKSPAVTPKRKKSHGSERRSSVQNPCEEEGEEVMMDMNGVKIVVVVILTFI